MVKYARCVSIDPRDVEAIFRGSGALREGHFVLASGRHSALYLEKFEVLQRPDKTERLSAAIAEWARISYGWLGRSPDYKAAFLATLGANADFYDPYQDNAKRWYREAQERVLYWNHAIIHPPVDRNRSPEEVSDVFMHVEEERDDGQTADAGNHALLLRAGRGERRPAVSSVLDP